MGKDLIHLCVVFGTGLFFWSLVLLGTAGNKGTVQKNHHFHKKCLVKNILPRPLTGLEFMDKVHKTGLFLGIQVDTVRHVSVTETETVVQIRLLCREPCKIFRVNGKDDPLMGLLIDLGQVMALKLVDEKDIPWVDIVKTVVDQELFSTGDGIVDLVAVMDMHVHDLFVTVKMSKGERMAVHAVFHGFFAGGTDLHPKSSFVIVKRTSAFRIHYPDYTMAVQNIQYLHQHFTRKGIRRML